MAAQPLGGRVDEGSRDADPRRRHLGQGVDVEPLRVRDLSRVGDDVARLPFGGDAIISELGNGQLWLPK